MPTPITTQKIQTPSGIISIPIYALADMTNNSCRINTSHGIGCYELVDPSLSALRISTSSGIKGINLTASATNYVDYNTGYADNVSLVTTVSKDATYTQIRTSGNTHGYYFPITGLVSGQSYTVKVKTEMLQSVDDVVSINIRNLTTATYIKTNVATATFSLNNVQTLTGTFTASFTAGNSLVMQVIQSWRNSTNDNPFEYRIYSDSFSIT